MRSQLFPFLHRTIHSSHRHLTPLKICSRLSREYSSSASDKLFADAAHEEAEENSRPKQSSRLTALENEHENWDGDERIEDTVLRMLVDKYKPLRTGSIQSAEQKLKFRPPEVRPPMQVLKPMTPTTGSWATEPLLPSKKDHQPWHTTFKVPSHATPSVKNLSLPPLPAHPIMKPAAIDDKAKKKEREERKRLEYPGRLARAKEATLDYRLGHKGSGGVSSGGQKARQAGLFQNVKGRGKPLVASIEESNPFIAREEFLMNRIVQRNGAVPPWVEVQGELDKAVNTFREVLRQSWVRRVIRNITSTTPPALLHTFTLDDIKRFRDKEWERREQSYHSLALEEVNALVRKYNAVAPYAVRRPYYIHTVELERVFNESAESIIAELKERMNMKDDKMITGVRGEGTVSTATGANFSDSLLKMWSLRELFKTWLKMLLSKLWRRPRRQ
ncbi:hypothetical protein H0H92_015697 [Tricholoma furcatifolium]|nr:hypothetical protein H0H92_015697 [Tricholoma furcatifolium]